MGGRNRHYGRFGAIPDERSTLGGALDNAIQTINVAMQRTAALEVYEPSREQTIAMLFQPSHIQRSTMARGIAVVGTEHQHYDVSVRVRLALDYDGCKVAPIDPDVMQVQPSLIQPLSLHIAALRQVYERFEEVKAIVRWLNKNATAGAIRYYWPPMLKLCAGSAVFADLQECPTRYHTPPGISDRAQMLRDTSAAMAAAALLPLDGLKPRSNMQLTFSSYPVQRGEVNFTTDSMTFNL